jgi:glycosyltransferase involved in cell wall biosynthesis
LGVFCSTQGELNVYQRGQNLKKVLIISYYWPPSGGAGVQRWLKFAKYLPEFGWQPHIYTPSNPEAPATDESLMSDLNDQMVVIKQPIFEPYSFYKTLTGKKGKVNAGFLSEDKGSRDKFTERMSIWIRGNFFIPDARILWVRPSVKFLQKYIQDQGIEMVISTGPPHSMHLIAMKLKEKMAIKWIADFRDPWTNIDFYKELMLSAAADRKHHRLEKQVLQKADSVIAIGATMQQELETIRGAKVDLISNGFDESDFHPSTQQNDSKQFNILHIGSINLDRNHPIFWESINSLRLENENFKRDFRLIFVGKLDYSVRESLEKYHLKEVCQIIPYLPHNQLQAVIDTADLLYLPLNNTLNAKGVVSGKLFEYLASGKPILSIGHPTGDAAKILAECNAGSMIGFDAFEDFKESLLFYYHAKKDPNVALNSQIQQYSRRNLTHELVRLIESI